MNQRAVKKLKKIIGYQRDDPVVKKHFKRLKKKYNSLLPPAREIFLKDLEQVYNINDNQGLK